MFNYRNDRVDSPSDRTGCDYQTLMQALSGYASPRDAITRLVRNEKIIRLKKGIYIFNEMYRKQPLEPGIIANMLYGPSMVSLEYALAYYALIPERVEEITSVTTGRPREFKTPVGRFSYRPTLSLYPGIQQVERNDRKFLMAAPERALGDKLRNDRHGGTIRTLNDMSNYLFDNLRIEPTDFVQMSSTAMREIAEALHSEKIRCCALLLKNMKKQGKL
jgi:hypothetical protein